MKIGESAPIRRSIPLTPLVDIVFLLLMFFMLSSTFTKFGSFTTGAAGVGETAGEAVKAKVFPGAIVIVTGPNAVSVNGTRLTITELPGVLDGLFEDGVRRVALRAHKNATVQDLVSAWDATRQSNVHDVFVAR
jgi:biopolymer transport protein ExbD